MGMVQPANEAIYLQRGAEREQHIMEGARREGVLVPRALDVAEARSCTSA